MQISGISRTERTQRAWRLRRIRRSGATVAGVAAVGLALTLSGCGGGGGSGKAQQHAQAAGKPSPRAADPTRIPELGDRYQKKIPDNAEQVVVAQGEGVNSSKATLRVYTKHGDNWSRDSTWAAHNGKKGWTAQHRENDKRSPVGVYGLSDAGGVQAAPSGTKLPYQHTSAFTPAPYWPKATRHDFDHVIAVNYNRNTGVSPLDPARPQGESKGGSIWLHRDHGSGTSGCVSVSNSGIRHLLQTLDPKQHPVVVMGDKASLAR